MNPYDEQIESAGVHRWLTRQPVFLCGCHRTGTTMLQRALSMHPSIDILPETKLLAWFWSPRESIRGFAGSEVIDGICDRIGKINREWAKPEHGWRIDRLRAHKERAPDRFRSAAELMEFVLEFMTDPDAALVGEKTPLHIYHISSLINHFDDPRVLITQRDLRAGLYSQATRNQTQELSYRPFQANRYIASWISASALSASLLRSHGSRVIEIVQYEELVNAPGERFAKICRFLGVDPSEEMQKVGVINSSFEGDTDGVSSISVSRWRDGLPKGMVERADVLAGKELNRCGYTTASDPGVFGSLRFVLLRLIMWMIRVASILAPRMVCFLGRDPRYRRFGDLSKEPTRKPQQLPDPEIIVLGNHKSGTTAIARLLAACCGLTETIDLPRGRRKEGYLLARGQRSLGDFRVRNADLFTTQLVKIPAMTFTRDELAAEFPDSEFLFVVRDPRSNIRSILNRRGIPGNRTRLPLKTRIMQVLTRSPSLDARVWGGNGDGYVSALAARWCRAIDALDSLGVRVHVVRYEDFVEDKQFIIEELARMVGREPREDISGILDQQFQPAGNQDISWTAFFGDDNLIEIERVCGSRMHRFGYETTGYEGNHG